MTQQLKLSRYVVASDALAAAGSKRPQRVLFSTRSGALVLVDARVWALAQAGDIDKLQPGTRERLVKDELLVPSDEDELATVVRQNVAAIEEHDVLYQVVQPTAWCQLDCGYCGQAHDKQRLPEHEQTRLLQRMRERLETGEYRELRIGWFGAEPLAGLSVMRTLGKRALALAAEFGVNYSARIVTNGMALGTEIAEELVREHGIHEAEVTLDGLEPDHDRRRYTKAGNGSFRKIWSNLLEVAARTQLGLVIRCNVDRDNADGVSALIEELAERGLQQRVRFYTSPVYAWGNDAHLTSLTAEEYAERDIEWLALQLRLGFPVALVPGRRKIVCLSVQRDAEVTDAHGTTFNCTEVSYVPAYGSPSLYAIRLGRGTDRSTHRSADTRSSHGERHDEQPARRLRDWNEQLLAREHESCVDCNMLPVCGGQCPKSWQEGHAPCPSAKLNIRQRLNVLYATARTMEVHT